jgi:hypothetical protein
MLSVVLWCPFRRIHQGCERNGRFCGSQFAATTRTYFYQFDDRRAPGLNNNQPGYQWGAGHAMELAYLGQTQTIGAATFGAEHQCSFWAAG